MWVALRGQSSFWVHVTVAALVVLAAAVLGATLVEWCILLLCITVVMTAEMLNTALEFLARAVDKKYNPHLADGLDIGSGAVLMAAIGAAVVGALVLIYRLGAWLNWWL